MFAEILQDFQSAFCRVLQLKNYAHVQREEKDRRCRGLEERNQRLTGQVQHLEGQKGALTGQVQHWEGLHGIAQGQLLSLQGRLDEVVQEKQEASHMAAHTPFIVDIHMSLYDTAS